MFCSPAKILAGDTSRHHGLSWGLNPRGGLACLNPKSSSHSFLLLLHSPTLVRVLMAKTQHILMGCPSSWLSACPSPAVFSRQEDTKGMSRHKNILPVWKLLLQRDLGKSESIVKKCLPEFSTFFHSWEQISAFWLKLRRVILLQADTGLENLISNHSSLAKLRATANTDL